MNEILSLKNPKLKTWMKLHDKKYRDNAGCFLIEGEHLIKEAQANGVLETLLVLKDTNYDFEFIENSYYVNEAILAKLAQSKSGSNCIGICKFIKLQPTNLSRVLLLDDVQDPGNLGTIIRTSVAFGFEKIYLSKQCVDVYNDKVIRSTQGALFQIAIERADLHEVINELKTNDFKVYATNLKAAKNLSETKFNQRTALVFGNEGSGVSQSVLELADENIIIEMAGFESLNVAIAAGICMREVYLETSKV